MKKFRWYHYLVVGVMVATYYIGEATELLFLALLVIAPLAWWLFGDLFPEKPKD